MSTPSCNHYAGPLIAAGILLALVIPYITGYFFLATGATGGGTRFRVYKSPWQEVVYRPAAQVESLLTGREVVAAHRVLEP